MSLWPSSRFLFLSLALGACTRFGLRVADEDPEPPAAARLRLPESAEAARAHLKAYLLRRGRLENEKSGPPAQFRQPWVRDTSLRYYLLDFDRRVRHSVSWRGLWTLSALTPHSSELKLEILELVFFGPPANAPLVPDEKNEQNDWFEAEPDTLRASLELRRFWQDTYPRQALPTEFADLKAPSLEGPPTSKELKLREWKPLSRPRAF